MLYLHYVYIYALYFGTWLHSGFRHIRKCSGNDCVNIWRVFEGQRSHLAVRTGHPLSGEHAESSSGTMRLILGRWSSVWEHDYSHVLTVMGWWITNQCWLSTWSFYSESRSRSTFTDAYETTFLGTKEIIENFLSDLRKETWKGVIALRKCLGENLSHLFKGDIQERLKGTQIFPLSQMQVDQPGRVRCWTNSSILTKTAFQNL